MGEENRQFFYHSDFLHYHQFTFSQQAKDGALSSVVCVRCVFAADALLTLSQDAEALTAVQGQVGTLVLDLEGQVLSSTGELVDDAGEQVAESVFSILQVRRSLVLL